MPLPLQAQGLIQPIGVSDADALASTMRRLGSNPLDLDALLTAGELSVRLDDLSAAGAFFARAEKIDPRSARAKAGEGAILVRSERPAESLRYFAQAEQLGLPTARFAADRGLAYDLLGDPGRAQRDYKVALAQRDEAETRRRYALSLGIAGRQAKALDELAPLVRQNDRAAWRTRAFVLAMGGDAAEASRIAQTMMPPGAAAGLAGFFVQLPRLSAVDRAFAVHFGEVRASPQRLADARLAPRDTPLPVEAEPVRVAAVQLPTLDKKRKKDRKKKGEVQVAAVLPTVQPLPQPPAYAAPGYRAPAYAAAASPSRDRPLTPGEQASLVAAGNRATVGRTARPAVPAYAVPAPTRSVALAQPADVGRAPVATYTAPAPSRSVAVTLPSQVAAVARQSVTSPSMPVIATAPASSPATVPPVRVATTRLERRPGSLFPVSIRRIPVVVASKPSSAPLRAKPSAVATGVVAAAPSALSPVTPAVSASDSSTTGATQSLVAAAAPVLAPVTPVPSTGTTLPTPGFAAGVTTPAETDTLPAPTPLPTVLPPATVAVASAAPLSAAPTPGETPLAAAIPPTTVAAAPVVATTTPLAPLVTPSVVTPAPVVASRAPARRTRVPRGEADSILAKIVAGLSVPASELDVAPATTAPGQTTAAQRRAATRLAAAAEKASSDKKAATDKKLVVDRKALADKKAAADKKALAAKEAADEKKAARGEPARIWVQVAGGANEAGLALAWKTMKGKAPVALAGRQAYTTPLRATNRVLTGPFKTDAEARAYVNQLAKQGVGAFTFTSTAGQKITKLDTK